MAFPRRQHPFLSGAAPVAVAHRGGAEEAPENTLAAFDAAIHLGFRYLETDVHLSRDGVLLAFHDAYLDRVSNGQGAIAHLPMSVIEKADAGFHFSPDGGLSFPFRGVGLKVPRLEEVLSTWPGVRVNIDPKHDRAVPPLLALLDRLHALDRTCIGAFSDRRLRMVRTLSRGQACTSMGPRAVVTARLASWLGRAVHAPRLPRMGADCLQIPIRQGPVLLADSALITAAHGAGLPVHVWTVNERAEMNRLLDLGVDGIMSDRPRLLREVFERRGLALDGGGSVAADASAGDI